MGEGKVLAGYTMSSRSTLEIPGQPWGLETIQERLQGNVGS